MESYFFNFSFYKDENFSLKEGFLQKIQDVFSCQVFLETGTLFGQTSEKAARIFPEVHTIELSESLYQRAVKLFDTRKNIFIYHGDSGKIFPDLLKILEGRIVFWLDGHFSGGETAKSEKATPIIEELQAIKMAGKTDSVILIDDLRNHDSFFSHAFSDSAIQDYPSTKELCNHILSINHRYQFAVLGDILLAFIPPETMTEPFISEVVNACTISRLSDTGFFGLEDIINAETEIGKAEGLELELLQNLYKIYRGDEKFGHCKHYRLWYALTLLAEKNYPKAYKEFMIAKILGLDHWRIDWYLAASAFSDGAAATAFEHLSTISLRTADFQPADDLHAQIINSTPERFISLSVEEHLDLAVHYSLANNPQKSSEHLNQAMILDSDHSRVRLQYAEMLVEVDQLSLAEEQLNRILENNSSYSPAYNDLGVLYRYWGNLVKAMEYFGTAFDLDNKNYKALENMLSLAGQLGLADQAKGILQEIITKEGPLPILIDLEKKLGNAHPA